MLNSRLAAAPPIHHVNQPVIVDPTMSGQAYLTRAAGGDAFVADLHRRFEVAQRVGVQFGGGETLVTGKTAAMDALRYDHLLGTTPGDVDQRLGLAKVLSAASDMHGDR